MSNINEASLDTSAELEAINEILEAIGEDEITTLENSTNADAANARRILRRVNRRVQAKGWTFNIEEGVQLHPDVFSKKIPYLPDYLKITTTGSETAYANLNGFIYDRMRKTDIFEGPITVDLVRLRTIFEMPECFRELITTMAARQFNNAYFGADQTEITLRERQDAATIWVNDYELEYGAPNMLTGDAHVGGLLSR